MPDGSKRHCAELIGDRSVAFLKAQPADKPFCLYMSFNISHAEDRDHRPGIGHFPWPKAVDGLYEDITPPLPRLGDPAHFERLPDFLKTSLNRVRWYWRWDTPEKYTINMRALYRMITGMDRVVGRVLKTLEDQGLADNTVVLYTADNGYYMGDRGFAGKWSHFDQSLRVPLIICDPRLPAARRGKLVSPMALNLDLPSTMLDLAGIPVPDSYQGRSLSPVLQGVGPTDWRREFFCEHHQLGDKIPAWAGVRGERYVYARYDRQAPPFEFLHDLGTDPDQLENLAGNPAHREVLERLRTRTDAYIRTRTRPEIEARRKEALKQKRTAATRSTAKTRLTDRGPYRGGRAVFDGSSFSGLPNTPPLTREDSHSWALRVSPLPGNPPGAILLGNRHSPTGLNFMKVTAERGVQLFANNTKLLKLDAAIPAGVWTTVALVKNGGEMVLYVNGKVTARADVTAPLPAMSCYLGGDPRVPNEAARCRISHAVVVPRALSAEDVLALFQGAD